MIVVNERNMREFSMNHETHLKNNTQKICSLTVNLKTGFLVE